MGTRDINEDGINDTSKRRKYKKIVTTVVDGTFVGEVRNLTSTVEAYAPNPLGDEDKACGDDEGSESSNDSHAEVPNDEDFDVRALAECPILARILDDTRRGRNDAEVGVLHIALL